ncbi:hypothetical protein R1T16_01965 [Flavobacterium sp. DG1-102-2]|uniref:hypothetical protein n=1 Tax=Flavobacterium sp. DG1-102-2 TaxID=3081663 RepID=UPI00294A5170|nr:hypothetical protein [Flavobacterium sp. DG1-102-2]MDV6167171.1 hypothetical protein [Flavobacterium sp. DG1-102-2]
MNGKNYDISNASTTNQIIKWLYDTTNNITKEEINRYNTELIVEKSQLEIALSKLFGGYSVMGIIEAVYNPQTGKYDTIGSDWSGAQLYFSRGSLGFLRKGNPEWKFNSLTLSENSRDYYLFADNYGQQIMIDKNFRFVMFFAELKDGKYQKTYTYSEARRDETIKQPF